MIIRAVRICYSCGAMLGWEKKMGGPPLLEDGFAPTAIKQETEEGRQIVAWANDGRQADQDAWFG